MNLIFLDTLKTMSGYSSMHSIRTWLSGMDVSLMRIGKKYAVDKESFENAIMKKNRIVKREIAYQPTQRTEKEFLSEIQHLLSKRTEV